MMCLGLASLLVLPVLAESWTHYPPYYTGYGTTSGGLIGLGMWTPAYYIDPATGRIDVLAAAEGFLAGLGTANATGWLIDYWPSHPSGGGGYCPFVYVWDGTNYVLDNNILPSSELSKGNDVEDYYKLEKNLVNEKGKQSLLISEFESEHSYIDRVSLLAIDHNPNVNLAITEKGEILTYRNPKTPISAIDNRGKNRLGEIGFRDGNPLDSVTHFDGFPGDYLVLSFGEVDSENAKLILRTDMKKMFECILVQVIDAAGAWQTVETLVPRENWSDQAVNLSPYLTVGQDLTVRLYWKYHHKLDYVALDTTPQDKYEVIEANLVRATHSVQGNVKELLSKNDGQNVELVPDEQIKLDFTLPNNTEQARTYVLYTKGHYVHQTSSGIETSPDGEDPVVSFDGQLRMDGQVTMWVVGVPGYEGNWAQYYLRILLWIYDCTTGTYATQTVLEEWAHTIWFEGAYSYTWNYDKDLHSTFNADLTHRYKIMVGLNAFARAYAGGLGDSYVDVDLYFDPQGTILNYMYLSWT